MPVPGSGFENIATNEAAALALCGLVSELRKAGCAPDVPGSVCRSLIVPRLFDAACFLIVV
jgi:hypothetical protein